jgi:uncharacterized membrane protein YfcA
VTSVASVITFTIMAASRAGPVVPDWPGRAGLARSCRTGPRVSHLASAAYFGARLQLRVPEQALRPIVGILVVVIGARYLWSGLG